MEKISVEYQVTLSDFRKASYLGVFLRNRKALRIMFAVLIAGILYAIGGAIGYGKINPLVLFLAMGYFLWGIWLFSGTEKGIRTYMRSKDTLIGCTYRVDITAQDLSIAVPERKINFTTPIKKLTCAFEFGSMFLIYTSMQDVYILPTRVLQEEQKTALRTLLRKKLADNFGSRYK